jgi:hypothetical protein
VNHLGVTRNILQVRGQARGTTPDSGARKKVSRNLVKLMLLVPDVDLVCSDILLSFGALELD